MTYDRLFHFLTLNGRELFHTEVKKMLVNSNFIFRFTFCFGFLRYLSLPRKGTRICQNFYIHTFCNIVSRRIVHLLRTIFHMNLHWLADKHYLFISFMLAFSPIFAPYFFLFPSIQCGLILLLRRKFSYITTTIIGEFPSVEMKHWAINTHSVICIVHQYK